MSCRPGERSGSGWPTRRQAVGQPGCYQPHHSITFVISTAFCNAAKLRAAPCCGRAERVKRLLTGHGQKVEQRSGHYSLHGEPAFSTARQPSVRLPQSLSDNRSHNTAGERLFFSPTYTLISHLREETSQALRGLPVLLKNKVIWDG